MFTTQPARIPRRGSTPNYWTGNGRNPFGVQEKNVLIELYEPPTKPGFMEPHVVKETTHAYFPVQFFDEVDTSRLNAGMIFGRVGPAYIALLSRHPMHFVPFEISSQEGNVDHMLSRGHVKDVLDQDYDLVQFGPGMHYFVTELSSQAVESFGQFKARIVSNPLEYDVENRTLSYTTRLNGDSTPSELRARYSGEFFINQVPVNLQYNRFEGPYIPAGSGQREAEEYTFAFNGHRLTLNYSRGTRTVETPGTLRTP